MDAKPGKPLAVEERWTARTCLADRRGFAQPGV